MRKWLSSWGPIRRLATWCRERAAFESFDGPPGGRGKRGALRLIYCFHGEEFPVFLLTIYGKSQQANLTKAARNEMKKLVPSLVGGYWKGRQR